jgi:hypothetical protein
MTWLLKSSKYVVARGALCLCDFIVLVINTRSRSLKEDLYGLAKTMMVMFNLISLLKVGLCVGVDGDFRLLTSRMNRLRIVGIDDIRVVVS